MRAKDLESRLCILADRPPSDLDLRSRGLRERGLLPVGGRGPHAPHIGPAEAAYMLMALAARRATDAADVAISANDLALISDPTDKEWLKIESLGGLLRFLLSDPAAVSNLGIERIELREDGQVAWVHAVSHTPVLYVARPAPLAMLIAGDHRIYYEYGKTLTSTLNLHGAMLQQLARELRQMHTLDGDAQ